MPFCCILTSYNNFFSGGKCPVPTSKPRVFPSMNKDGAETYSLHHELNNGIVTEGMVTERIFLYIVMILSGNHEFYC